LVHAPEKGQNPWEISQKNSAAARGGRAEKKEGKREPLRDLKKKKRPTVLKEGWASMGLNSRGEVRWVGGGRGGGGGRGKGGGGGGGVKRGGVGGRRGVGGGVGGEGAGGGVGGGGIQLREGERRGGAGDSRRLLCREAEPWGSLLKKFDQNLVPCWHEKGRGKGGKKT